MDKKFTVEKNIINFNRAIRISYAGKYEVNGKEIKIEKEPEVMVFRYEDLDNIYESGKDNIFTSVVKNDSFGYVIDHISEFDSKPLVLNFANPFKPGGGVKCGAWTQEEDLCRRSNLYMALESDEADEYYSQNIMLHNLTNDISFLSGILITDVTIFADSNNELLENPIVVDILTVAAPINDKRYNQCIDLSPSIEQIIEMILDVSELNGYTQLVLGAFGCGAFGNDPDRVAYAFKTLLESGKYNFKDVVFPIPATRNTTNYDAFMNHLNA